MKIWGHTDPDFGRACIGTAPDSPLYTLCAFKDCIPPLDGLLQIKMCCDALDESQHIGYAVSILCPCALRATGFSVPLPPHRDRTKQTVTL